MPETAYSFCAPLPAVRICRALAAGAQGETRSISVRPSNLPDHVKSWQAYWDRCDLILPDEVLQSAVDMERYKIFCNERADSLPVTLQGVWNLDHRMPPWFGDLHNDLNVQACYWPAFKTGCGELASAYIDCYHAAMPRFMARAKALFGLDDAIHVPVMMAPDGSGAATEWCFWNMLLGPELFVATDFCTYFDYTLDLVRLREKIYPFLQGVLALYQGIARTGADGFSISRLRIRPSYGKTARCCTAKTPPSLWPRFTFSLPECSITPRLWAGRRTRKTMPRSIQRLLPVTHTEKGYPIFPGRDVFASHRHFCHLFPIFPLGQDGHSDAAKRSLDTVVNMGFGEAAAFTFPYLAIFAARCGRGNMARTMLRFVLPMLPVAQQLYCQWRPLSKRRNEGLRYQRRRALRRVYIGKRFHGSRGGLRYAGAPRGQHGLGLLWRARRVEGSVIPAYRSGKRIDRRRNAIGLRRAGNCFTRVPTKQ